MVHAYAFAYAYSRFIWFKSLVWSLIRKNHVFSSRDPDDEIKEFVSKHDPLGVRIISISYHVPTVERLSRVFLTRFRNDYSSIMFEKTSWYEIRCSIITCMPHAILWLKIRLQLKEFKFIFAWKIFGSRYILFTFISLFGVEKFMFIQSSVHGTFNYGSLSSSQLD